MAEEVEAAEQKGEQSAPKKKPAKTRAKGKRRKRSGKAKPHTVTAQNAPAKYPRHTVDRALRISNSR
jgi:hypothetical protein